MATKTTITGGLLDAIREEVKGPGPKCGVARLLTRLPDPLAADFQAALADPETYPSAAIGRAMTKRGYPLSSGIVQHHRQGACSCDQ